MLADREIRGEIMARKGEVVYDQMEHDYGLANDDSRITGIEHRTVTKNPDGKAPGFTVSVFDIKPLSDELPTGDKRLALIIARTVMFHEGGEYDYHLTALQFGASKYEATVIGHACYWVNDLMEEAQKELGIVISEDLRDRLKTTQREYVDYLKNELAKFPSLV